MPASRQHIGSNTRHSLVPSEPLSSPQLHLSSSRSATARQMPHHPRTAASPTHVSTFPAHPSGHSQHSSFDSNDQSSSASSHSTFNFVEAGGNTPKKRARRKYDQIERRYMCNWEGCQKGYGVLNHLNSHVRTHNHGPKRDPRDYKAVRKQWRKAKKDAEAAMAEPDTIIPPPGSLDTAAYRATDSLPPISSLGSHLGLSTGDDDHYSTSGALRRGGLSPYDEKPSSARPAWLNSCDKRETNVASSYPEEPEPHRAYNCGSYLDEWSRDQQWTRQEHPDTYTHAQSLSVSTIAPSCQRNRSPISPLTPTSEGSVYLPGDQLVSSSFTPTSASVPAPEYPSHTPSPPYSNADSADSYSYHSYYEPQPQWTSPDMRVPTNYHTQSTSSSLISSSYPPANYHQDVGSPGAASSYSAPSPTYGYQSYPSTSRPMPEYSSWRGQDGQ